MKIDINVNNHGIINTGNTVNTTIYNQEINYTILENELNILMNHCSKQDDKEIILEAINSTKEKNKNKLLEALKKLSQYTIKLIETLSLNTILELLKKYWI